MKTKKIGIVGLEGKYGRFWADFFTKRGCAVQGSDIGTNLSNRDVIIWADVVIIATTLLETVKLIRSIAPYLRENQLLIDIASTKVETVRAMLKSKAEVLGLHPFCAPPVRRGTFKGQTMFVQYARVSAWEEWVKVFLEDTEASIEEITPERHDLERTVDQMIEHMCTHLKMAVMRKLGLNAAKLFRSASPVYKLTAAQAARMYVQSADLYGGLAMSNPFALKTLDIFEREFRRYRKMVQTKDIGRYIREFGANQKHLGPEVMLSAFTLSEQLIGLTTDLLEPNSIRVTVRDTPGILVKIVSPFKEAGINLTVLHSRRAQEKAEFFIAFDCDATSPEMMKIRKLLREELDASLI